MNPIDPIDNQGRHPIPTVPPPTVASPHGIDFGDGPEMWWTPGWGELWKHLGWRWIFVLPLVGLVALLVVFFSSRFWGRFFFQLSYLWAKAIAWAIGLALASAGYAISKATRLREGPFCIHCGYGLEGLPDHYRCPECGMTYDWATIEEYRRDPKWFIRRWRERHRVPHGGGACQAGPIASPKRRDGT